MKNKWRDRAIKALLKVENVIHKNRWSNGSYRLAFLSIQKDFFEFFRNFYLAGPDFAGHYLNENSWSRPYTTFPQITKRMLSTDTFHWLELLSVILNFLKKFNLQKTFTHLFNAVFQKICKEIKNSGYIFERVFGVFF